MRGRYLSSFPLPPATDGYIQDGAFTYAGDSIVYAAREFSSTVRRVGAKGRWKPSGEGSDTTMAVGLAANDRLVSDSVVLAVNRFQWHLFINRGKGSERSWADGVFSPPLKLSTDYQFEIEATDESVTVRVPGRAAVETVSTVGLVGDRAFWQEFAKPEDLPAGTVFSYDIVWAAADGQPLVPVAASMGAGPYKDLPDRNHQVFSQRG